MKYIIWALPKHCNSRFSLVNKVPFIKMNRFFTHLVPRLPGNPQACTEVIDPFCVVVIRSSPPGRKGKPGATGLENKPTSTNGTMVLLVVHIGGLLLTAYYPTNPGLKGMVGLKISPKSKPTQHHDQETVGSTKTWNRNKQLLQEPRNRTYSYT